jgi:hypothetical protein
LQCLSTTRLSQHVSTCIYARVNLSTTKAKAQATTEA